MNDKNEQRIAIRQPGVYDDKELKVIVFGSFVVFFIAICIFMFVVLSDTNDVSEYTTEDKVCLFKVQFEEDVKLGDLVYVSGIGEDLRVIVKKIPSKEELFIVESNYKEGEKGYIRSLYYESDQ